MCFSAHSGTLGYGYGTSENDESLEDSDGSGPVGSYSGTGTYLGTPTDPFVLGIPGGVLQSDSTSVCFAHLVIPDGQTVDFSGHVVVCSDALGQDFVNVDVTTLPALGGAVPEPLTMIAVGMGIAGLGGYLRRRRMRPEKGSGTF